MTIAQSPSPIPGQWLWFRTCFPLVDFTTGKINRNTYYIVTFHLSSCVVYAENFQNIFSIHKNIFVLADNQFWWMESKLRKSKMSYIHLFRAGGEENPSIWHDTRVKNEMIIQKCCRPSKRLTEVSTYSQAVGPLNVNVSTNGIRPLKCIYFTTNVNRIIESWL